MLAKSYAGRAKTRSRSLPFALFLSLSLSLPLSLSLCALFSLAHPKGFSCLEEETAKQCLVARPCCNSGASSKVEALDGTRSALTHLAGRQSIRSESRIKRHNPKLFDLEHYMSGF